MSFPGWQFRLAYLSIHVGRANVDKNTLESRRAQRLQQVQGTQKVYGECFHRVAEGLSNRALRGQVQDSLRGESSYRGMQSCCIAQIHQAFVIRQRNAAISGAEVTPNESTIASDNHFHGIDIW